MLKKVKNFIEQHHMIEAGEKILAGVSGGADSVCLLLVLAKLQEPLGFTLAAVHVEHGIRGEESLADAAFTERLCRDLGIPCRRYSVRAAEYARERGLSLEEAARELRYGCFRQACREEGAGKTAVAHHGGDSAETMLFHLARGTGIRGLGGIAPSIQMDGMQVIRPLLCLTRQEIEGWLREQEQDFCVDATNADVNYARNRIRREVLPGLCRINSQAIAHMMNTAGQLREISEFLEEAAQQAGAGVYEKIAAESTAAGRIRIGEERFRQIHPVLQKTLLHQLIGGNGRGPQRYHLRACGAGAGAVWQAKREAGLPALRRGCGTDQAGGRTLFSRSGRGSGGGEGKDLSGIGSPGRNPVCEWDAVSGRGLCFRRKF